jgi:hypothetical protein
MRCVMRWLKAESSFRTALKAAAFGSNDQSATVGDFSAHARTDRTLQVRHFTPYPTELSALPNLLYLCGRSTKRMGPMDRIMVDYQAIKPMPPVGNLGNGPGSEKVR